MQKNTKKYCRIVESKDACKCRISLIDYSRCPNSSDGTGEDLIRNKSKNIIHPQEELRAIL